MKKLLFLCGIILLAPFINSCSQKTKKNFNQSEIRQTMPLAGVWNFKIDSLDQGINKKWYSKTFKETVKLPGSMTENGKGDEVSLKTPWVGQIIDSAYFKQEKYEKYRQPGNIKIPFWLKPDKYYSGVAWYQKEIKIPPRWKGKRIVLFLERCHWESTVYVNDKKAGSQNSLATPHVYDITDLLVNGKNRISIRMDNRMIFPIGVNSASISDHTQTNWNGIIGEISLRATSKVFISEVKVFPDVKLKKAKIVIELTNETGELFNGNLVLQAESFNSDISQKLNSKTVKVNSGSGKRQLEIDYPMGNEMQLWSEFSPALYKLSANLKETNGEIIDSESTVFGMREFKTNGTHFEVNGRRIFLRGNQEDCVFPLTGYPPTDVKSWEEKFQVFKEYGINHVSFNAWSPPEAAFLAADKLGIYIQTECGSWCNYTGCTLGDGKPNDQFYYDEGDRILKAFGNHPSFCMLAYGTEPDGKNREEYLKKLVTYWKSMESRMLFIGSSNFPIIPENEFNMPEAPRIQGFGAGLTSIINAEPPETMFDYRDYASRFSVPTISFEVGQWCAYPDFKEIEKYTGVLKATNFEIFKETLIENHMGDQAEDFLMASGKLQALCYKADIEAALRTPGFGGFHLLDLQDYPGQGSALVGVLNAFCESKGYITPEEFRMFSNETVPLARMQKRVFSNNESFIADVEIAHFGEKPLEKPVILCAVLNLEGDTIYSKTFKKEKIPIGNCIQIGSLSMDLSSFTKAQKLTLWASVENTSFKNKWDFWVYPAKQDFAKGNVLITDKLDKAAETILKNGGSVLFLTYGKVGKDKGAQIAVGFSSIFWNTAWTSNQAPHTLSILCDPMHPLFKDFPTEYHSNWQWWDPVTHSQAMILNDFPPDLRPLVQPIDTWFENRRLATVFETKTFGGKLLVCSIDLKDISDDRLASKQLLISVLNYMNSESFNPQIEVDENKIRSLIN